MPEHSPAMRYSNAVLPSRGQPGRVQGDLVTTKGGSIAGEEEADGTGAAFVHVAPRHMPLPVLIAVPHAGRAYPSETLAHMRDPRHSQLRLEDRCIDVVGVEVARATGTGLLVAHAPRAILDLNRSADDIDWGMIAKPKGFDKDAFLGGFSGPVSASGSGNARARSGLGLVPRRLPGFGEIWRSKISFGEVERRVEQIHRPYHEFLERELERIRDAWGAALLIDLHSMPPLRRRAGEEKAPRIVLGDRYGVSCDNVLASNAFRYLESNGCATAHNRPYSGGYVLDRHARRSKGIHGIQIEVCRTTYLDTAFSETTKNATVLANLLAGLVRVLGAETAGLGSGGQIRQAAE
ncbi:N-formylglutamate amidohydrolase [uncultured Erythrobacter sp.]|uniref:N-formylglutamate amidohydrolase n=1 Tax=uncultured Erythrobacter sp. TaxID=263913 RepID=UPI002629B657|nr:N-formylglutamate amidohydrolase [uncultured Erythrobacter sp.]